MSKKIQMFNKKNGKTRKNGRCMYSGERTDNKEVILEKYAIQYVRKMGYLVSNFQV